MLLPILYPRPRFHPSCLPPLRYLLITYINLIKNRSDEYGHNHHQRRNGAYQGASSLPPTSRSHLDRRGCVHLLHHLHYRCILGQSTLDRTVYCSELRTYLVLLTDPLNDLRPASPIRCFLSHRSLLFPDLQEEDPTRMDTRFRCCLLHHLPHHPYCRRIQCPQHPPGLL